MRIGRKKTGPTPRMRASQQASDQSFDKKFAYRAKRTEDEQNTGRQANVDQPRPSRSSGPSWVQKFGLIVLMIAIIASAVNVLTLSTQPKIIALNNQQSSDFLSESSEYESEAQTLLASSILNRSKLTINAKSISQQMSAKYPELASVSVTIPLLSHRPVVYIEPAKPVLIITTINGSFIVSETGKAILRVDNPADLPKYELPILTDESGVKLEVGKEAISATHVTFVDTVVQQLSARSFAIASLKLPPASSELDVQITGQPYIVKFNFQNDTARHQAGTFISTMGHLQKQNIIPAKYVDVRVNGRAYYQ